jgi:hypothetical protein
MKSIKTGVVCLAILSLAFVPELARAGVIKDLWNACKSLLESSAIDTDTDSTDTHLANADHTFAVEISDVDGQAYVYDVTQERSQLRSTRDPRIVTILTDDLSGNIDSSQHIGYLDSSWSPDGQILLLVDGYGNIEAHELRYFQELLEQRKQNPKNAKPIRTKVRRHANVISFGRSSLFIPNIKWLSTRTVEIRNGDVGVSLVANISDDGVIGLRNSPK